MQRRSCDVQFVRFTLLLLRNASDTGSWFLPPLHPPCCTEAAPAASLVELGRAHGNTSYGQTRVGWMAC